MAGWYVMVLGSCYGLYIGTSNVLRDIQTKRCDKNKTNIIQTFFEKTIMNNRVRNDDNNEDGTEDCSILAAR